MFVLPLVSGNFNVKNGRRRRKFRGFGTYLWGFLKQKMSAAGENFGILTLTYKLFRGKNERRRRNFWGLGRHNYNPALSFENENLKILGPRSHIPGFFP